MSDLIFLDTETTGLDPEIHEIWEIAWAVNDEPVQSLILPHSITKADPKALELNNYWRRANLWLTPTWGENWDLKLRAVLDGSTIVCANPTFDRMMMRKRWGYEPYHYRSIDIESMALGVLQYDRPRGLAAIAYSLREIGYDISEPNHSAQADVVTLRECFHALRNEMTAYPRKVQ